MSNSEVVIDKADKLKNSEELEVEEEDVPEDFFDDFLKNDFLAGLEVLDEDESPAENKFTDDNCEKRSVSIDRVFKNEEKPHDDDVGEKRSVSRERVFKTTSEATVSSELSVKKPVKERLGIRVIENISVNKSKIKSERPNRVNKDAEGDKNSGKRSRSRERNGKGSAKNRNSPGRERRRERGRSKEKLRERRSSKERRRNSDDKLDEKRRPSNERERKSDEKLNEKEDSKDERERLAYVDRRRRSIERREKMKRSTSADRRRRSRSRHDKNRKSGSNERREGGNTRRDPNKTMRDIQRDKVKCAKDKEAKFISEKLKVVETGLVPPGMEMEMEVSEPPPRRRSRSRSTEAYRRSKVSEKEASDTLKPPPRKRTRSRSNEAYRRGKYSEKSPSPKSRRRYRSPSPSRRDVEYRPRYRRSPLTDKRSEERKRERRSKERKPTFLEELDEKLNVHANILKLEQIKEKINGGPAYKPHPVMPLLSPVTPLSVISHQPPHFPPVYDEQFFIGQSQMHPQPSMIQPHHFSMQVPPPNYNKEVQQLDDRTPNKSMDALFNDENISLSAFLSITTRAPDNSKTMDLQEKIKVISRCQDAIKLMTETSKQSGRFFYKGSLKAPEKNVDFTNVSPMKRILPVRLNFTKRTKKLEEKPTTPLELLLHKLGLKQPTKKSSGNVTKESANLANNFTQTESFTCGECEVRKRVKTVSIGVQSVETSSDFSCQVSEDDFLNTARSALKNILKNQSLAALTPAQLMSQLGGDEKEIFPAARKFAGDPHPMETDSGGVDGIGYHRNNPVPVGSRMDYNRRPQGPRPLMQIQMPIQPPHQGPYQQGGFHPHQQNPQFRPYYEQPNQFHRY